MMDAVTELFTEHYGVLHGEQAHSFPDSHSAISAR